MFLCDTLSQKLIKQNTWRGGEKCRERVTPHVHYSWPCFLSLWPPKATKTTTTRRRVRPEGGEQQLICRHKSTLPAQDHQPLHSWLHSHSMARWNNKHPDKGGRTAGWLATLVMWSLLELDERLVKYFRFTFMVQIKLTNTSIWAGRQDDDRHDQDMDGRKTKKKTKTNDCNWVNW